MQSPALSSVRALVSARLPQALDEHTAALAHLDEPLGQLLAPARDLFGGGKRLRALLCATGWAAARGGLETVEDPAVVSAGTALELFQGAALVHDDVMDGSLLRRGMPTAHRRFATAHREAAWLGDAETYGQAGAILLGDLLLTLSSMEMDRVHGHAPGAAAARGMYDLMVSEVAVGQYLDMRAQAQPWAEQDGDAVKTALDVVRHKSARYSVEHPLVLGAALGGAGRPLLDQVRAAGAPLGEAFQLRDDHLGVFGDPEVTGKPAGDDLREGKRTVLVALAMQRLDGPARRDLRGSLGRPDLELADVERLRALLEDSGAVAAHETMIAARYEEGVRAVHEAPLPPAVRDTLLDLAAALTRRTA